MIFPLSTSEEISMFQKIFYIENRFWFIIFERLEGFKYFFLDNFYFVITIAIILKLKSRYIYQKKS